MVMDHKDGPITREPVSRARQHWRSTMRATGSRDRPRRRAVATAARRHD